MFISVKTLPWYSANLAKAANKMSFPFNFAKISKSRHFTVHGSTDLKLLPDTAIDSTLQKNVLASLLLFSFACYKVVVNCIKWTEIASLTASNVNNSWLIYVNYSKMINNSRNIWAMENWSCQLFLFWK